MTCYIPAMADTTKYIAYAMVGITVVVIIVGAVVLKTMLDQPADPACDHLKQLDDGDKIVEQLQRTLDARGVHETGSCHATVQALSKALGPDKAPGAIDCLARVTSADASATCVPSS